MNYVGALANIIVAVTTAGSLIKEASKGDEKAEGSFPALGDNGEERPDGGEETGKTDPSAG